jgi:hypothetical protein
VPVFEAAEDIAEVEATAMGEYSDSSVEVDQEYFYWLVQADNDVEVAITNVLYARIASATEEPLVPEVPSRVALFIPFLDR